MGINGEYLSRLVSQQLKNFFIESENVEDYQEATLERVENCLKKIGGKYYSSDDKVCFSPFHSAQYSIYLYYLSNTIYKEDGSSDLSDKIYYLNKIMNGVDWYCQIELPDIFGAEHPLGSVMGRAKYSDYFYFYQGCTVGGNELNYPEIGKNVIMYSNSTILGKSKIGDNVLISTGATIKDEDIPSNCIVFGQSPNLIIKNKSEEEIKLFTRDFWK